MNNKKPENKKIIERKEENNKRKKTNKIETTKSSAAIVSKSNESSSEKSEIPHNLVEGTINKSSYDKVDKVKIPNGKLLEYRIKRLMFYMGYYTKVGIEMKTSLDEKAVTITDLDVYGIYVHKDFTSKTLWADCKSGGARVHERISWIKGIMNTVQINNALFVKSGVRTEIKQYARDYGIQVLDLNTISKLEKDYNITSEDWSGSWNIDAQHNQLLILSRIAIPTNDIYKKIANFISCDYWVLDNYSRIKKIITAIRELSKMLEVPIPKDQLISIKWAINELTCLFLLTTLNIAKELYYFNDKEKYETIVDSLSAGEISNKKRKEIFDAALRFAYGMVQNQIPEFVPPSELPQISLSPPKYTEAYYDLILRVTNNPLQYYDLLRFLDYSLMEYDLQSENIDHSKLENMFTNYDDLIIGAKTLLHFISQITNLPRSYFQILK